MAEMVTLTNVDLLLVVAVSLSVVGISWRNRPEPVALALAGFMLTVAVWGLAHLLAHLLPATELFRRLRWLGIGPVAFVWIGFVLAYVGWDHVLTRSRLVLLSLWPLFVNALIWLPAVGRALGVAVGFDVWRGLYEGTSTLFWTHVLLSYGLFAAGTALLIVAMWNRSPVFRRQWLAVLVGVGSLWLGSAITVFELFGDLHVHFLPAGLTVMGVSFLWATTRARLTDLVPVATSRVLESVTTGVLVTDEAGRVIHINGEARTLLGLTDLETIEGESMDALSESTDWEADDVRTGGTIELGDRIVEVSESSIETLHGRAAATVYVLTDVTARQRRQRELERQNERLDRFASLISHDLRNPLTVANGSLDLARRECETDHLDRIESALDRIEVITEETLTLARAGQALDEAVIEPVSLRAVARTCWDGLASDGAELALRGETTVVADRERLRHVFENLFRNSIEHAEGPVSVAVGPLDEAAGFFVEDDGPGIPPAERQRVFEPGYSTADSGTGFGLNIVRDIADAHGWEVSIVDGSRGGARFEFHDVDVANVPSRVDE